MNSESFRILVVPDSQPFRRQKWNAEAQLPMRKERPARKSAGHLPVATGGMSRLAYKHAQAAGLNLEAELQKAGLTRAQIENPRAPIKVRDQIKFLNLAAAAL